MMMGSTSTATSSLRRSYEDARQPQLPGNGDACQGLQTERRALAWRQALRAAVSADGVSVLDIAKERERQRRRVSVVSEYYYYC